MKDTHNGLYTEQAYSLLFTRIVEKQSALSKITQTPDFVDMIPVPEGALDNWLPDALINIQRKQQAYHTQQSLRFTLCEYQDVLNTLYKLKQLHTAMTTDERLRPLSSTNQRVLHWVTFSLNTLSLMITDSFSLPIQSQRDTQAMARFRTLTWAATLKRHLHLDHMLLGLATFIVAKSNPSSDYEGFLKPSLIVESNLHKYLSLFLDDDAAILLSFDPAFLMTLNVEYPEYKWINCEFSVLEAKNENSFLEWRFRLQKEHAPAISLVFRLNREFAKAQSRKPIPWFDAETHIECYYRTAGFSLDAFEKYAVGHQDVLLSRTLIALSVLELLDDTPERELELKGVLTDPEKGSFLSLNSVEDKSAQMIQEMMDEGDLDFMDYMNIDWRD